MNGTESVDAVAEVSVSRCSRIQIEMNHSVIERKVTHLQLTLNWLIGCLFQCWLMASCPELKRMLIPVRMM